MTLLQETWGDPWRMLVCCVLANRTRGAQARPVLERLFARYATPGAMALAESDALAADLRPLGLHRRRAVTLIRLAAQCAVRLPLDREHVLGYAGCGRYAADSYAIFVEGDLTVEPDDRVLRTHLLGVHSLACQPRPTRSPRRYAASRSRSTA